MRVVLDTNVVLSGLLYGGRPLEILNLARSRSIEVYTSLDAVNELLSVLARSEFLDRLQLLGEDTKSVIDGYMAVAVVLDSVPGPGICADPTDDPFIGLAITSKADFLVTGDKHLLACAGKSPVRIVTPSEFLSICSQEGLDRGA